ncbi:hypothetical protein CR513_52311, partial [Mucuna pruriens]
MTLSLDIIESLRLTFILIRWVGFTVKLPSTFALDDQSPSDLRKPLHASITFGLLETIYLILSLGLSSSQNLSHKKIFYLRIVIVTTVVHQSFGRWLLSHQVTNFLDLPTFGRHQPLYMSYSFAETYVFGKQLSRYHMIVIK